MTETQMILADPTLHSRFWAKVSKAGVDDCWEWTATRSAGRYGAIKVGGKFGRDLKAHRVQALWNGISIEGFVIRHKCNNTGCVNPRHLIAGSQFDNVQDMLAAGRQNPSFGNNNGQATASPAQVTDVIARLSEGQTGSTIARETGLSRNVVYGIASKNRYPEIARPQDLQSLSLKGSKNPNAKVSEADVAQMRTRYRQVKSFRLIADETGFSVALVQRAVSGTRWPGPALGVYPVRPEEKQVRQLGLQLLNKIQVSAIRAALIAGTARKTLAEQYGVSKSLINGIAQGRFYPTSEENHG